MATYTLTTDWDSIQERNIDPHSPVTSENHNKLLKAFGNSKLWAKGLDITFIVDITEQIIVIQLSRGTVYVDYMVIDFCKDLPTVKLTGLTEPKLVYLVVDYTYRQYLPAPIATIKVIDPSTYDADHQLILYKLALGDWNTSQTFPTQSEVDAWFSEGNTSVVNGATVDNFTDNRSANENLPAWAVAGLITIEGGVTNQITITDLPENDTDAANKAYVDQQINNHSEVHDDYFVRKYPDADDPLFGKVRDSVDIYKSDPELGIHDTDDDNKGLLITANDSTVTFNNTKKKYVYMIDGVPITETNSDGVTAALWNADIAEYFPFDEHDPDLQTRPEHGTCICLKNGKAYISNSEGDPSCIGFVSYKPANLLGGSDEFDFEFKKNHRIPVAILGQLKWVCVYTNGMEKIDAGALLVSGLDGRALAVSPYNNPYPPSAVIGKALVPIYPGENEDVYILVK